MAAVLLILFYLQVALLVTMFVFVYYRWWVDT